MNSKLILVCAIVFGIFSNVQLRAEEDFVFWPRADYDPSIPTIEKVLGYQPGERITWHSDTLRYFEALAKAEPKRVALTHYAKSWEGRQLYYVVISSPENSEQLDNIKQSMQQLADPRKTKRKQAEQIIQSLPAVVWLSYGVHGNEISPTEAAMLTAYHLLASKGDARVADMLENAVVIIDPLQNPDGRDRFTHNYEIAKGLLPDPDPLSVEHNEPWPSGRSNHYFFDLNRDWFIQTQPETQGRARAMLEWYPIAFVDAHETSSAIGNYFFPPPAPPYNPHMTNDQKNSLLLFGKNNARWFDRFGVDYYSREIFDAFYPGYGASWPSFFGSVGMTYEQTSTRGLVIRRDDGHEEHYREGIRNHFITSLATIETVVNHREHFLTGFYNYRASAIEEGLRESVRTYIVPAQNDQPAADKLARLLTNQGIEVDQALSSFKACSRSYAAGSYVIRADQPAKRLVRTLMDKQVPIKKSYLADQEQRRAQKKRVEIYDVTAWSLPLMFNVTTDTCKRRVKGDFVAVNSKQKNNPVLFKSEQVNSAQVEAAQVAYLIPWGKAPAIRFLSGALRRGLNIKSLDKSFTHQNTIYPAGTLILNVADNPQNLASQVTELARAAGVTPVPVNDSWVKDGPNFGSPTAINIDAPRIAIAWDRPVDAYNAGNTRYIIEQQFDYPVTAIRVDKLAKADLSRFQVLILPGTVYGSSYTADFGDEGIKNLKDWVSRGGVLIGLGSANRFLADPNVDLLAVRREEASETNEAEDSVEITSSSDATSSTKVSKQTVPGKNLRDVSAYRDAILPKQSSPDTVVGALVKADVDPEHWLGAGVASSLNVLVRDGDIYTPIPLDKGVNVARFSDADKLLLSGHLWEQNRKQLAYKPFVVIQATGKGYVIGFTQDPNVRAYLDGLNVIFMNAIFRAPAHARPVR